MSRDNGNHGIVELVVTDIGGVLVKTDEAIVSCIERAAREQGIPPGDVNAIHSVFGASLSDYVHAYLPPEYKERSAKCYDLFQEIYPEQVLNLLSPFPRVDDTLLELKCMGMKLAVLSCMLHSEVETNLSLLSFKSFDAIFSLEDYGEEHKRPDPEGLLKLIATLGCTPCRTIYVGDSSNDVLMGRNAGAITVAVRTGMQPISRVVQACPDYIIDSFKDIVQEVI
jgi:HAD superfamily hydrolase (TIGR01549 family)